MTVLTLAVIIGVAGLALNLGTVYNRKVELQNLANAAAMAAAVELDGTAAGLDRAVASAAAVAGTFRFHYGQAVTWSGSALRFGSDPHSRDEGSWEDAASARALPAGRLFALVDTARLEQDHGLVHALLMPLMAPEPATTRVHGRAVAGRTAVRVTPLAICAQSNTPAAGRANGTGRDELVEYGFRRGVSYDLLNLNPGGTQPENFVISPYSPKGTTVNAGNANPGNVGPYVCAGAISVARATDWDLTVVRPFPADAVVNHINGRFAYYSGSFCRPNAHAPDVNIKQYAYDSTQRWMQAPAAQSVAPYTAGGQLGTIADVDAPSTGITGPMWGPLWAYAKAVPYEAYRAGQPEPAGGYPTFGTSDWANLYPGAPALRPTYPYPAGTGTPYSSRDSWFYLAPGTGAPGLPDRRVLNVALLQCPVAAGIDVALSARALAIGRFFLTVPAVAAVPAAGTAPARPASIFAEFAGVVPDQSLGADVVLFP